MARESVNNTEQKGGPRNAVGISAVGERSQVLAANQTRRAGNHRKGSRVTTDVKGDCLSERVTSVVDFSGNLTIFLRAVN